MSAHRPKQAALGAYADGRLSAKGRARIERHLAGCEVCRRALGATRAYEAMTAAARDTPPPELDFARLEQTLAREAQRISGEIELRERRRPRRLALGAALAAAALGALYLAYPTPAPPRAERRAPAAPVEAPEPAPLTPVVTLAAGTVEAFAGTEIEGRALEPGTAVAEGERLRTGDDGIVHVRLADGTAFVLERGSELTLSRARPSEVALSLSRGRVASLVAPLAEGARYVVRAADHAVEVRGTRFAVSRFEGGLGVDVAEGRVEVRGAGEALELAAPARWRSDGEDAEDAEGSEVTVPAPRHASEAGERTLVRLEHPALVRWEIDGTPIASAGPVRLWLREGEHALRGWDARQRLFSAQLPVGREPVVLAPEALRPERARLRPGHLPEAEIAPVVQRGRPQLARCYERALRVHDQVAGQLRLRVTVGAMGEVTRVRVLGADTPELRRCVSRYVGRWTFAPPGGPVTFELPLAFSARL